MSTTPHDAIAGTTTTLRFEFEPGGRHRTLSRRARSLLIASNDLIDLMHTRPVTMQVGPDAEFAVVLPAPHGLPRLGAVPAQGRCEYRALRPARSTSAMSACNPRPAVHLTCVEVTWLTGAALCDKQHRRSSVSGSALLCYRRAAVFFLVAYPSCPESVLSNTSSTLSPKASAIRNASGSDGSKRPFSMALTELRETCTRSASSA